MVRKEKTNPINQTENIEAKDDKVGIGRRKEK